MDVGPPPNARSSSNNSSNSTLSVDSSKGRLVVERMDSIRNLFGCELRIVDDRDVEDRRQHRDCGGTRDCGGGTTTFAVSRLDEYQAPDDQLVDRLKVKYIRIKIRLKLLAMTLGDVSGGTPGE